MANLQAPPIREIRYNKLAANFAEIEWDSVGSNFRYEIHIRAGSSADTMTQYRRLGYNTGIVYFMSDDIIQPNTYYQFRVRAVYAGFDPGEWTESDIVLSYNTNSYSYSVQDNFILSTPFTTNFFLLNDKTYIDIENDTLYATLVRPGFEFDKTMEWYTEAGSSFVKNSGFQVVYKNIPVVCKSIDRVIPAVIDDVIYLFERFQKICKVSNDGGNTWHVYDALRDRAGNPIDNCIAQQNTTNTFVLGYDYIYQGIPSLDLTFDNDRERWSTIQYTFEKLDVENPFGFNTERFTPLAPLPVAISTSTEAFSADDYQVIACAEDRLYEYKIRNPRIEDNPSSPHYGNRVFNQQEYRITNVEDAVVKKIEFYKDPEIGTDLGTFYLLVVGTWIRQDNPMLPEFGKKLGIDDTAECRGVYKMNRTPIIIPNPDFDPSQPETEENPSQMVSDYQINGFVRVYGNSAEERERLTNNSTLSRDEKYLLLGVELDKWGTVVDPNLDVGLTGVKFFKVQNHTTYQQKRLQVLGTTDGNVWKPVRQDYYGSGHYNWMDRTGTRDFKDWENNIVYIRPETIFTVPFDDVASNRWTYTFNAGTHTFNVPDLTINEFSGYTDGALIHNQVGRMIGYFKFVYRSASPVEIKWSPTRTMLVANLTNYAPVVIEPPAEDPNTVIDPDIVPLLPTMMPESYISDTGLFKKFCEYYLQFISRGDGTSYNQLYNLMNSRYARSIHYTEYLYKEIYARNRVLDKTKREEITRFFLANEADFYSTKGILNSYKFLFKMLYNEEVDIEVESLNRFEYFITVSSDDMTDDMVGRRIYTPTGSADITYYERVYIDGIKYWKLTLNNLIGQFLKGQQLKSTWDPAFVALIQEGVKGDTTNYNSDDYKNRSSAYYLMKIRSELQANQYKDDVIRFIHPVGFNFVGITLLTVLINQGLSINHNETIVDLYTAIKFDQGSGREFPSVYPSMDRAQLNPNLRYDVNGKLIEVTHPRAGEDPLDYQQHDIIDPIGVTEEQYNDYWEAIDGTALLWGMTPAERRGKYTPSWDASYTRWSELLTRASERLKDNIGNPYDPAVPTQKRVGE